MIDALDRSRYEIVPIAIDKEGKWVPPAAARELLPASSRGLLSKRTSSFPAGKVAIIGDPSHSGLTKINTTGKSSEPLDVIFPALHGPYGEDGTIQGLLEMANIPYVGCGVVASACGMDKVIMKSLFKDAGLPICKYTWFLRSTWKEDRDSILRKVRRDLGFPVL